MTMKELFKGKTTSDILNAALGLKEEAKTIKNAEEHGAWWDRKVDLLRFINDLLETGGFDGLGYDELWTAKQTLYTGEAHAGKYAENN